MQSSTDASAAPATSSSSGTGAALAVEVPTQPSASVADTPAAAAAAAATATAGLETGTAAADEAADQQEQPHSSRPASPLNIHSLLNRPFGDVVREITSSFQFKSTVQVAAEQLRYLVLHREHDAEVLGSQQLMALLLQQVRDTPGSPAAASCMAVLAHLARRPDGRAQLWATGVLNPVLKFLGLPGALSKSNTEPALLLLQNMSCDRLSRHSLVKSGAVELLLTLLAHDPMALKQQQPKAAAYLTGTLLNLVAGDGDSSSPQHTFVKAGGMEAGCKVLADWGRYDFSPATLRLRLLLADIGKLQQYAVKLHQTALDASTSARSARGPNAPEAAAAAAGQLGSSRGAVPGLDAAAGRPQSGGSSSTGVVSADVVANAGLGIPLGTPRMPASERLTAMVLQHGKNLHDDSADGGNEQ